MRNFVQFILHHYFGILFIFLEIIAFALIVSYNQNQRSIYLSSSAKLAGGLFNGVDNVEEYFSLRKVNEELARENAYLKNQLPEKMDVGKDYYTLVGDSTSNRQYIYRACKVINNSVFKHFNYITLNKGTREGISPDMGVLSSRGVVGIVIKCSDNYSTALSLLNSRLKISAKLKDTGFFGSISWNNKSPDYVILDEIPEHADVKLGEQVVTSGYSFTFPEGILIGTVDQVEHPEGESFYKIRVKLSVDFSNLNFVEIVENKHQNEQVELEEENVL